MNRRPQCDTARYGFVDEDRYARGMVHYHVIRASDGKVLATFLALRDAVRWWRCYRSAFQTDVIRRCKERHDGAAAND